MGFDVDGLDEFKQELLKLVNEEFKVEKKKELTKIGLMAEREIKHFVPVDTGRLRASINTQLIDENTAEVGTNVKYAKWVNDGHMLDSRFIPKTSLQANGGKAWRKLNINTTVESKVGSTSYINETIKLPITDSRVKGFKTHPQYILGRHFMEKGLQNAEPKIIQELDNWLNKLFNKAGD
ncbi:HK97 gp10 family phage protein [Clostridium sp. BJN0013]|uniref:HK97 gp10 family phage protein n=1 Tax=Clostridium sp. BJN0013 TaxID=3236840 RepID=UPI0034C674C7